MQVRHEAVALFNCTGSNSKNTTTTRQRHPKVNVSISLESLGLSSIRMPLALLHTNQLKHAAASESTELTAETAWGLAAARRGAASAAGMGVAELAFLTMTGILLSVQHIIYVCVFNSSINCWRRFFGFVFWQYIWRQLKLIGMRS